jgi:hypothetical protein
LPPSGALRIEHAGWYLAFIIFAIKLSGVFHILQICFAKSALLKQANSRKPKPPDFLDNPNFSQFIQWIPLSFPLRPQKNLDIKEFISEHKDLGILNIPIQYVGIAWTTAFNKISFPACDKKLIFQ